MHPVDVVKMASMMALTSLSELIADGARYIASVLAPAFGVRDRFVAGAILNGGSGFTRFLSQGEGDRMTPPGFASKLSYLLRTAVVVSLAHACLAQYVQTVLHNFTYPND